MGASGDAQDVEVDGGVDGDLEGARQLGRALMMLDGFVQRGYSSVLAMMQDDFIALDPSSKASARWRFHHDKVDAIESRFLALLCSAAMRAEFRPLSSGEAAFAEGTQNSKSLPVHIDWDKVEAGFLDTVPGLHEYAMNDPPHFADRLLVFHRGVGVFKTSGFFYSDKMDEVFARLTEYLRSVTIDPPVRMVLSAFGREYTPHRKTYLDMYKRKGLEEMELTLSNLLGRIELEEPTFKSVLMIWREKETPSTADAATIRMAVRLHNFQIRQLKRIEATFDYLLLHLGDLSEAKGAAGAVAQNLHSRTSTASQWCRERKQKVLDKDAFTAFGGVVRVPFAPDGQPMVQIGNVHHFALDEELEADSEFDSSPDVVELQDWGVQHGQLARPEKLNSAAKYGLFALQDHPIVRAALKAAEENVAREEDSIELESANEEARKLEIEKLKTSRVYCKELKNVPLSELKLAFPGMDLAMSSLDRIRITFLAGMTVVSANTMLHADTLVSQAALFALGSFVVVVMRLIFRYNVARVYCSHRVAEQHMDHFASCDAATVASLLAEAGEQESKSAMLVYAASVAIDIPGQQVPAPNADGQFTTDELCQRTAALYANIPGVSSQFADADTRTAITTLRRLGLLRRKKITVKQEDESMPPEVLMLYEPLVPEDATAHLKEQWVHTLAQYHD